MKILVTGAAGRVGRYVAEELLQHGHSVRCLDKNAVTPELRGRVEGVYADLTDRFAMLRVTEGCDAIAHLGGIPFPGKDEERLFPTNVLGTQHLLAAAETHGIQRFVLASTCAIYGLVFQPTSSIQFHYLPVDENHPIVTADLYSLSKQCNEQTAATYTRRCGMATTCLRLTHTAEFTGRILRMQRRGIQHSLEYPSADLWAYIHVKDAARAFRLALEKVEQGHHVMHIVSRDLLATAGHVELLEKHYPNLLPFLDGFDYPKLGFWDTSRAKALLGFVAEHSWRQVPELQDLVTA